MSSDVAGIESTQRPTYNASMKRPRTRASPLSIVLALVLTGPLAALAQTGLPLPRFASLRASKVHLRTGPGVRYRVEWVFVHRSLPVEIVADALPDETVRGGREDEPGRVYRVRSLPR